jgi:hypothetical protein
VLRSGGGGASRSAIARDARAHERDAELNKQIKYVAQIAQSILTVNSLAN